MPEKLRCGEVCINSTPATYTIRALIQYDVLQLLQNSLAVAAVVVMIKDGNGSE